VARSVLDALTPAELQAVLEHEAAHVHARDNVKRWLLACAPTLGWRRAALGLERAWEEAAEHEADRASGVGLHLASALIKTARLARGGPGPLAPAAAFHGGGNVARRIRELVEARAPLGRRTSLIPLLWLVAGLLAAALPLGWPQAHHWAEILVHLP
jgi:Zn-dependent protease with chaperone function